MFILRELRAQCDVRASIGWQAEARPTLANTDRKQGKGAGIALKRLVLMDFATDVTVIVVYSSQIHFEPQGSVWGTGILI